MSNETSFIGYSIGLNGKIDGEGQVKMFKAEFRHIADGTGDIQLRLVSGLSLGEVPAKRVRVKHADWDVLPHRTGTVEEAQWALGLLGVEV